MCGGGVLPAVQAGHIGTALRFHIVSGVLHHIVNGVEGRQFPIAALGGLFRVPGIVYHPVHGRILNGAVVKEAPPAELPLLIREVRRVGYNIDQLLKRANSIGLLDVPQLPAVSSRQFRQDT